MDLYITLVQKIIKEQETIIGPVAIEQASKVEGLRVDPVTQEITFVGGNKKEIIERLVRKYESLFGLTSIEVCKDAIRTLITPESRDKFPQILL